jgi:hypothetical protein
MKRLALVTVALVVGLTGLSAGVATQSAEAHSTTWYWNTYKASQKIRQAGLDWRQGYDQVNYVRCSGYGDWIRGNRSARLYRHFNCYVEARYEDPYWITLHVTGRNGWDYEWLAWD